VALTLVNHPAGAERVLAAARSVLTRDGASALSMRTVASEAGVTATAIYRHFKDKDALLRTLIREQYDLFLEYLATVPTGKRPIDRLMGAFDRYLDFALEQPNGYELLFVAPHGMSIDRYPNDFASGRSRGFRQLKAFVAQCMAAGELRDGDPTDVALDFYAHAHGIVMLHRAGRFGGRNDVARRFYRRSLARLL
jgi:AcrR family transcriptional regulator